MYAGVGGSLEPIVIVVVAPLDRANGLGSYARGLVTVVVRTPPAALFGVGYYEQECWAVCVCVCE